MAVRGSQVPSSSSLKSGDFPFPGGSGAPESAVREAWPSEVEVRAPVGNSNRRESSESRAESEEIARISGFVPGLFQEPASFSNTQRPFSLSTAKSVRGRGPRMGGGVGIAEENALFFCSRTEDVTPPPAPPTHDVGYIGQTRTETGENYADRRLRPVPNSEDGRGNGPC